MSDSSKSCSSVPARLVMDDIEATHQDRWVSLHDKKTRETPSSEDLPPNEYICPITCDLFIEPVVCADGFSYETTAIVRWLAKRSSSPLTGEQLETKILVCNTTLKKLVEDWRVEHNCPVAPDASPLQLRKRSASNAFVVTGSGDVEPLDIVTDDLPRSRRASRSRVCTIL